MHNLLAEAFLSCIFGFTAEASLLSRGNAAATFGSADGATFPAAMRVCETFLINFDGRLGWFLGESFSGLRTSDHIK
jgi:hypothetical protein